MTKRQTALRAVTVSLQIDPLFAAIERHKVARAALKNTPDETADKIFDRLIDEETKLARSLMATAPATKPGLLALLRYVQEAEKAQATSLSANSDQLAVLLATIETAVQSLSYSSSYHRVDHEVTAEMEVPLLEARALSKVMTMALAGKDKVAISEEDLDDALERLSITIENHIDDAVKLWGRV
jgi:hypothetical protein